MVGILEYQEFLGFTKSLKRMVIDKIIIKLSFTYFDIFQVDNDAIDITNVINGVNNE